MPGRTRAVRHPSAPPPFYQPPDLGSTKPEIPHPRITRETSRGYETREVLLPGVDDGPRAIAYGEQRLAGKLQFAWYRESYDDLWLVIELCAGECDGLIDVALADGKPLPATGGSDGDPGWNYWWYPGTAAGQVNPNFQTVLPSWSEAFPGTAYVVVQLRRFSTFWKLQLPALVWHMRTRKCLLPDTGTYVYSTNLWDQWYDFARWSEGKSLPATRVDAASFVAARNADIAAGRKADSHLLLLSETSADEVIQTFRVMCRAYWFWTSTKYRVVADRPASSIATYDDDHVSRSSVLDLDRADVFDRPNKITIWYTDVANGWQQKPMSLATAAVDAGTEDAIEEEYRLPHLHDPAQVKALLTYLLNSRLYDARLRERWLASTSATSLGDVVTRHIASQGLTIAMRLVRRTKNTDNTFEVELFEHNDAKFAEYVITDAPKLASTFPDPSVAPPNVDPASIGWSEELYPTPNGDWLPKATLTFTPPASFPYLDKVEVWLSINGGPQRHWFDTSASPALTPALWETGTYTLTLKTRHRITQQISSGTTVSFSVAGVTGVVPEVVGVSNSMQTRYWSMPQTRSLQRYGAASWTHSGLTTFNAAAINDGVLTSTCAVTPSGASWLRLDAGVGVTKEFRELAYYHTGSATANPEVQYSDNATTWISVNVEAAKDAYDAGSGVTARAIAWMGAGAHRYWRVTFTAAATFREFHFAELLGQFSQVREFRVYDMRSGSKQRYITIPAGAIPTSAAPLNLGPITTTVLPSWNAAGSEVSDILITVVNSAGAESVGVRSSYAVAWAAEGASSPYIAQEQTALTLSNGTNNAVALGAGPGFMRATGPTAAYSLGGLAALSGGTTLFLCNATAFQMTVLHESAPATAANRIITPSGGSVIVQPGATVAFTYDSASSRWRLWWDSIEWSSVNGKPTAITRVQNMTGTYSSIDVAGTSNGYAGIRFPDSYQDQTLMFHNGGDLQGVYRQEVGQWSWYWQNGQLVVGTVPWGNIGSKPTTLSGYGITDAAPLASPAFTGTPTAPTPPAGDSTTRIATTAFVQANGGGLERVASVSPSGATTQRGNVTLSTTQPEGFHVYPTTTASTTNVAALSITGKGVLRFLSYGPNSSGSAAYITVLVDGSTIINDMPATTTVGTGNIWFNRAIVGALNHYKDGSNYAVSVIPCEFGWTFKSSLQIYIRNQLGSLNVTGVAFAYTVY